MLGVRCQSPVNNVSVAGNDLHVIEQHALVDKEPRLAPLTYAGIFLSTSFAGGTVRDWAGREMTEREEPKH
jgi:hypothetical protein